MEWNKGKPEEHDSLFSKYYGTDKWSDCMFRKCSNTVLATIESNGQRIVDVARTIDGEWKNDLIKMQKAAGKDAKVISWTPFPEPDSE